VEIFIELEVFNPGSSSIVLPLVKDIHLILSAFLLLLDPIPQILAMDIWVDFVELLPDLLIE
jgi:hypothetical protein